MPASKVSSGYMDDLGFDGPSLHRLPTVEHEQTYHLPPKQTTAMAPQASEKKINIDDVDPWTFQRRWPQFTGLVDRMAGPDMWKFFAMYAPKRREEQLTGSQNAPVASAMAAAAQESVAVPRMPFRWPIPPGAATGAPAMPLPKPRSRAPETAIDPLLSVEHKAGEAKAGKTRGRKQTTTNKAPIAMHMPAPEPSKNERSQPAPSAKEASFRSPSQRVEPNEAAKARGSAASKGNEVIVPTRPASNGSTHPISLDKSPPPSLKIGSWNMDPASRPPSVHTISDGYFGGYEMFENGNADGLDKKSGSHRSSGSGKTPSKSQSASKAGDGWGVVPNDSEKARSDRSGAGKSHGIVVRSGGSRRGSEERGQGQPLTPASSKSKTPSHSGSDGFSGDNLAEGQATSTKLVSRHSQQNDERMSEKRSSKAASEKPSSRHSDSHRSTGFEKNIWETTNPVSKDQSSSRKSSSGSGSGRHSQGSKKTGLQRTGTALQPIPEDRAIDGPATAFGWGEEQIYDPDEDVRSTRASSRSRRSANPDPFAKDAVEKTPSSHHSSNSHSSSQQSKWSAKSPAPDQNWQGPPSSQAHSRKSSGTTPYPSRAPSAYKQPTVQAVPDEWTGLENATSEQSRSNSKHRHEPTSKPPSLASIHSHSTEKVASWISAIPSPVLVPSSRASSSSHKLLSQSSRGSRHEATRASSDDRVPSSRASSRARLRDEEALPDKAPSEASVRTGYGWRADRGERREERTPSGSTTLTTRAEVGRKTSNAGWD